MMPVMVSLALAGLATSALASQMERPNQAVLKRQAPDGVPQFVVDHGQYD